MTSGKDWPDGSKNELGPRSVILLAGEDSVSDKVKPELRVAGADVSKVKLLRVTAKKGDNETQRTVALDRDFQGLVEQANKLDDLAIVAIDPITNYLGNARMNNEEEVRKILMPLVELSQSKRVCVITVGHLNKRGSDASALQRVMGATAFVGVCRKLFLFGGDPEDDDKYTHIITETRDKQVAMKYKTNKVDDPEGIQKEGVVQVQWLGAVERDSDEVVNQPKQREKSQIKEAAAFIKAFLRDGAKPTKEIEQALKDAGIDCSETNVSKAAKKVAKSRKQKGKGKTSWEWYLATSEQIEFDTDQGVGHGNTVNA